MSIKCVRCSKSKSQAGLGEIRVMGGRRASPEETRQVRQKIKDSREKEIKGERKERWEGMQWASGKWRQKGLRNVMRRSHLWDEMAFQQSSRGASLLSWLVVPCSPLAPQVKLSLQVVALRVHVTAHSETTSLKERAQDLSHKETAVGHGEEGASEGWGASSFCQRMPPPSWAAASTSAAQYPVLCSHLQRHILSCKFGAEDFLLSHFNSYFCSSYNFCFHALAVSIISTSPD